MHRIRRPTHATVIAYVALFVALGGGTTAVALQGSNSVQSDDLGPGAQVKAADVAANAVNGSKVADNSLGIADLASEARGARAYARFSAEGSVIPSKNISDTAHFNNAGIYCFTLVGIDPASAVVVVSADYFGDSTSAGSNRASVAEWDSDAPDCDPGQMEVRTFSYRGDSFDNNDGTGSGPGDDLVPNDEAFSFAVP